MDGRPISGRWNGIIQEWRIEAQKDLDQGLAFHIMSTNCPLPSQISIHPSHCTPWGRWEGTVKFPPTSGVTMKYAIRLMTTINMKETNIFSLLLFAMFEEGRSFAGRIMSSPIMPQNLPKITSRQRHLLTLFQPNHFLKPANLLKWNNWKWWDPNLGNPNRTWGWNKEEKKRKRKIFLYRKSIPPGKFNRISWDPKTRTVL